MDEQTVANFTTLKNDIEKADNELKLNTDYTYNYDEDHSYVSNDGISIEKDNFVIDGQGHTLNGAKSVRIFNVNGTNVTLKNINFINGKTADNGGSILWNGAKGTIQNCNFTNHTSSQNGGAICINNNAVIEHSTFINNNARLGAAIYFGTNSEGNVSNCEFKSNTALSGVLYYNQVYGRTVDFCKFADNIISYTGIIMFNECNGTVKNSYFENNSAKNGAGVYISYDGIVENSTFTRNRVQGDSSFGSAIYFNRGFGQANNCNFSNNLGHSPVFFNTEAKGMVNNSNFNSNKYGAIEFSKLGGIVENSNFTNNNGDRYGAIYSFGDAKVNNCSFINNTAGQMGAAIYSYGKGNITNSNFINNTLDKSYAEGQGGAISINKEGFVDNCNFINNSATNLGGAIYFGSNGFVNNSNFTNNIVNGTKDVRGGAIFVFSSFGGIENCIFKANQAKNGGVLYFNNNGNITNCIFDSNAGQDGGAIYIGGQSNVIKSNFNDNNGNSGIIYALNEGLIEQCTFTNNQAKTGGAVSFYNNGTVVGCNFTNNKAINGGAIYAIHNSDERCVVINQSLFNGNVAENGSAVYYKGGYALFIDSNFTNNNATGKGTLFLAKEYDVMNGNITSCLFENNFAHDGGAACVDGNLISYNNNYFSNDAVNGGALYVADNGFVNLTNDVFKENSAITGTDNLALGRDANVIMNNVDPEDIGPFKTAVIDIVNITENIVYGDIINITVNVTWQGEQLDGVVFVTLNHNYTATLENGVATISMPNIDAGSYDVNVTFAGESIYTKSNKPAQFTVNKKTVQMEVLGLSDIVYSDVLTFTVKLDDNKINTGQLHLLIGNDVYYANISNCTGVFEIHNLNAGNYNGIISYPDVNYNSTENISFAVEKMNATITANNAAYVINYGGAYAITLKDAKDNVLADKKVTFTLNGKTIGTAVTNTKGVATITLTANILKTAKTGAKNLVIKLENNNYNCAPKTVKITINKEKTKLTAKNKKFKKAKKVKKYTVTLKNSKGKGIKKVKVTLKIKGKKFTAKTNSKGKATFKIKNLKKKGKFKSTITFKGNAYYNKVTKKVKITVK